VTKRGVFAGSGGACARDRRSGVNSAGEVVRVIRIEDELPLRYPTIGVGAIGFDAGEDDLLIHAD